MLLRRITQHVKDQNWFAVLIDFIIVVFGVFVGMQVQSRYAENERRIADAQYMERLHDEVEELLAIRQSVVEPRRKHFASIPGAMQKIYNSVDDAPITVEECAALQFTHIYLNPTIDLPTVDELLSAGRLDFLSSSDVRDNIVKYTQSAARANDVVAAININSLMLTRKYPNLIQLDPLNLQDFGLIIRSPTPECDLAAMRENPGFLNDLADNRNRFDAYYQWVLLAPTLQLDKLHIALDANSGLLMGSRTNAAPPDHPTRQRPELVCGPD